MCNIGGWNFWEELNHGKTPWLLPPSVTFSAIPLVLLIVLLANCTHHHSPLKFPTESHAHDLGSVHLSVKYEQVVSEQDLSSLMVN